jgi:hypothetical protein
MVVWLVDNLLIGTVAVAFVLAFLLAFLRWLLTPVTWRDGEGPLIDEGERFATEFSWLRWLWDLATGRFWRH